MLLPDTVETGNKVETKGFKNIPRSASGKRLPQWALAHLLRLARLTARKTGAFTEPLSGKFLCANIKPQTGTPEQYLFPCPELGRHHSSGAELSSIGTPSEMFNIIL